MSHFQLKATRQRLTEASKPFMERRTYELRHLFKTTLTGLETWPRMAISTSDVESVIAATESLGPYVRVVSAELSVERRELRMLVSAPKYIGEKYGWKEAGLNGARAEFTMVDEWQ